MLGVVGMGLGALGWLFLRVPCGDECEDTAFVGMDVGGWWKGWNFYVCRTEENVRTPQG